ncbi:probable low affinity copper uptake protein 2 isoform X1 [Osmia bicornis bicornis]|uniref:probable low affinity copper uptake protein 2 isoform X1 n=1 Tax=Osmia bicornis bicornis TaxID=1437191 RepID=UPI0010F93B8A|nr:probable low affinity copper uptake protein 2 isoform X1 [Osmia bicornis bicornis]
MMHMWFWFGSNLGDFLLPGYNVVTTSSFFCTCLGLIALAILYEGMKILQIKLLQNATMLIRKQTPRTSENSSLLSKMSSKSIGTQLSLHCIYWSTWSFQVLHWSVHTFLGYLLMLAVMTYNVYINIALVLGGCLGYWIFGPKLIELNLKEFYKRQNILDCDKECADNAINYEGQGSTVSVVTEQLITEATIEVHMPVDV